MENKEENRREIVRLLEAAFAAKVGGGIGKALLELTDTIREFNLTTTQLTQKANSLIRWYVILTAVIAVATIAALFWN